MRTRRIRMFRSRRALNRPANATYPLAEPEARTFHRFGVYPNSVRIDCDLAHSPLLPKPNATRHFLGWRRPLLAAAVDHLLASSSGFEFDLTDTLIVTPGGRAGRMLLPMLAVAARDAGRALSPPRTATPGEVPWVLLGMGKSPGGALARRLAWAKALRSVPRIQLQPLIPQAPEEDRPDRWASLAEPLERASDELAGELLTFEDVPRNAPGLTAGPEAERWSVAALVQQEYERILLSLGLCDPALACLRAMAGPVQPTGVRIVLVGISELPRAARTAIERAGGAVDVLIAAPESLSSAFDELGCVRPDQWRDARIEVAEERIIFAHGPREQAAHALAALAGPPLSPGDAVLGIPDGEVFPPLQRLAGRADGLAVRDAKGPRLRDTSPARLLLAVASYLDRPTFENFAGLVRHPDIEEFLLRRLSAGVEARPPEWWLDRMDAFAEGSLPTTVGGDWPGADERTSKVLSEVADAVDGLIAPLRSTPRAMRQWADPIAAVLRSVYEGERRTNNSPDGAQFIAACRAIAGAIAELRGLQESIGWRSPAAQTIHVALGTIGEAPIPSPPDSGAIEALGWLELHLDPAPVVVVTGMNEESVPGISSADPLLPDSLRVALNLPNADRRLARDAYLLTAILSSRPRTLLIAGRFAADDRPLRPSRLLLAAPPQTVMARLHRFFVAPPDKPRELILGVVPGRRGAFPSRPRMPGPARALERLRVTAFRDYIASPYLFYLKHVLGLRPRDEAPAELDALSYGALLHDALEAFGRSDRKDLAHPDGIADFLRGAIADSVARRFGPNPSPLVDLQVGLLTLRLRAFADAQARHRREGWIIDRVEWRPTSVTRDAPFEVDGLPMRLAGRIDRIDRHEDGRRVFILDYKSAKDPVRPEKSHQSRDGWTDLQLPLYRHLAGELGLPDDPASLQLGYFAIPRDPGKTQVLGAGWSSLDLAEADEAARQVIRNIREGRFEEPGRPSGAPWVFELLAGHAFPDLVDDPDDADGAEEGGE